MSSGPLVRALLEEKHSDLYRNNATFYHGLNTLCALLPSMVDGLALRADEDERDRLAMQKLLEMQPAGPASAWFMPRQPLYCDDPDTHGCGRKRAPQ